jgi:hypothetical protein
MTRPDGAGDSASAPRYTWTCADCPTWAERYWSDATGAEHAADAEAVKHRSVCPGAARLIITTGSNHPERLGAERLIGNYDPDEPVFVPAWAVHTARALAGYSPTASTGTCP